MNRPVTYLKTHADIFLPGTVGALGSVLTSAGTSTKTLELKMSTTDHGVLVEARGQTILIPYGNVALAVVGPEAATNEAVKYVQKNNRSTAIA